MKPKFKELAEQSGILFEPSKDERVHFIKTETLDAFAQSIVRECAEIAHTTEPYQSSDLILKHFGITECSN